MQKERLGSYTKTALVILAVTAGVITVAALPGLAYVVKEFAQIERRRRYSPRTMRSTLVRLRRRGYIRVVPKGEELVLQLTRQGRHALRKIEFERMAIPVPATWDGHWRFIAFDIPERRKKAREVFREKLKQLGCAKLQKSVFVHPYPCEAELAFLSERLGISPFVHCITASTFNGERILRARYGL